jgi:hypothetical protein
MLGAADLDAGGGMATNLKGRWASCIEVRSSWCSSEWAKAIRVISFSSSALESHQAMVLAKWLTA